MSDLTSDILDLSAAISTTTPSSLRGPNGTWTRMPGQTSSPAGTR